MFLRKLAMFSLAALAVSPALAGPETFSTRQQTIRAGIVVLASDFSGGTPPSSAAPHAWFNLDSASRIKPGGWNIANPFAPSFLSGANATRWQQINAAAGSTQPAPAAGEQVTKSKAAYWEVFLSSTTDTQLANYDVLLVAPRFFVSLNSTERDKLRKFVDHGGVLWIDTGVITAGIDTPNNFPLAFLLGNGSIGGDASFGTQPLLTRPFRLNPRDIRLLNQQPFNANKYFLDAVPGGLLGGLYDGLSAESSQYQSVVIGNGGATVGLARIGNGFVVVSSRGIAKLLGSTPAQPATPANNVAFRADDESLVPGGQSAAKFAVNLIQMASEYRQSGGGPHRLNSTSANVSAPLLQRFKSRESLPPSSSGTPPVIYKGVAIMSFADRIVAYDLEPGRDYDSDGNADDGLSDFGNGSSADRLWESRILTGPISAPVTVETNTVGAFPKDQVLVTDATGRLFAFPIFPRDVNNYLLPTANLQPAYQVAPPNGAATSASAPFAPTVAEGLVYVTDTITSGANRRGRVWVVNPAVGARVAVSNRSFVLGGTGSDVFLPEFTAGGTIGLVPIADNSGGYDLLMYAPNGPTGSGSPNPNSAAGLVSIWLGSRGEKPVAYESTASGLLITTRASQQGGLPIWTPVDENTRFIPRIAITDSSGNPWSAAQMATYFSGRPQDTGGGVLLFPFRAGAPVLPDNVGIRIDYMINWAQSNAGVLPQVVRGQLNFPDTNNSRRVIGSLALSPQGSVFAIVGDGTTGGSFFGFREEGRGVFRCTIRYDLYDQHNILLNDTARTSYREVLFDNDGTNLFTPSGTPADARLRNFAFRSGPAVRNGQVFVGARATKAITIPGFGRIPSVPVGLLLAFRAEPEAAEIPVGDLGADVTILQPDIARSQDKTQPEQQSILQTGNFTYEAARGIIRIENLMSSGRGPIQSALSLSQPVIVRGSSGQDRLIEPDAIGGRWSPLLWYSAVTGLDLPLGSSQVFVGGDTVFLAGESRTLSALSQNPPPPAIPSPQAIVYAFDAEVSPNDRFLINTSLKPWLKQSTSLLVNGATLEGSPHLRWPSFIGITNSESFQVRLNQAVFGDNGSSAYGLVGGEGSLLAWGSNGLSAFSRSDVVVCDQSRLGIFEATGATLFTTDGIASLGKNGEAGAASIRPLSRPTRAYPVGDSDLLVVDSGTHRISRIDKTGREVRGLDQLIVDPGFIPTGMKTNESTRLRAPKDVAYWEDFVRRGATSIVSNQQTTEFWRHYLIADSGNKRLIEVVDRFSVDAVTGQPRDVIQIDGEPQLGVIVWRSPEPASGSAYDYNSVARQLIPGNGTAGRYVYVAGLGDSLPTRAGVGLDSGGAGGPVSTGANGGVVVFDPANPTLTTVINRVTLPDLRGTRFYDITLPGWRSATASGNTKVINQRRGGDRYLSNVSSVTTRVDATGAAPVLYIMITDANGVYEVPAPTGNAESAPATWYLPADAYTAMRRTGRFGGPAGNNPAGFRATYARRLDSGEVLIVNGYVGKRRNGTDFFGEVIQVDPDYSTTTENLGFRLTSIRYELSGITGSRGLVQPVFAERR